MAEPTREEVAQETLKDAINNCGFNPKRFAESTTKWHCRMNYSNWLSGSFGSMVQTSIDMTFVMNMLMRQPRRY